MVQSLHMFVLQCLREMLIDCTRNSFGDWGKFWNSTSHSTVLVIFDETGKRYSAS